MLRRLGIIVLAAGLAFSAHPAGSRIKRLWLQWTAAAEWDACRASPGTGNPGEPAAWMQIPAAGFSQLVIEGVEKECLSRHAGRTGIGQAMLIMGHRDTHFRAMSRVAEGHEVHLDLRGGIHRSYRIRSIHICDKSDVEQYIESHADRDRLLLVTCYPFRYTGPAPRRFVAVAVRQE